MGVWAPRRSLYQGLCSKIPDVLNSIICKKVVYPRLPSADIFRQVHRALNQEADALSKQSEDTPLWLAGPSVRFIRVYFDASFQRHSGDMRVGVVMYGSPAPGEMDDQWTTKGNFSVGLNEMGISSTHAELMAAAKVLELLK